MNDNSRFTDPGISLHDLATHFIVYCPKCQHKALINPVEGSWRLACTSCFHVEGPGHWYGKMIAYVSVKCRICRNQLTRNAGVDGQWNKLKMKCDRCGDECEYEAHLSKQLMDGGLMCDPVFGLKLWLQQPVGDHLFWAYHYEHLTLLEQYIRAKLRERGIGNKGSKNSLMFSRLPEFIVKARNRKDMLRLIHELQVK